jgi:hypothetical protein
MIDLAHEEVLMFLALLAFFLVFLRSVMSCAVPQKLTSSRSRLLPSK